MTFLAREFLWLLLVLPLLVVTYLLLLRRRKTLVVCSDVTLFHAAIGRVRQFRRHVPPLLLLAALAALLISTARPAAVVPMLSAQRTIVLAIDVSLSMAANDVQPSRLEAAQAAAKRFIRSQPRDVRIAIVSFAATADIVQSPTSDRGALEYAIDHLNLDYHTATGSGIMAALLTLYPQDDIAGDFDVFGGASPATLQQVSLERSRRIRSRAPVPVASDGSGAIVLLTDGSRTMGPDPLAAARAAADRGVRIFTVGFGAAQRATVAVDGFSMEVGFDEAALKEIAGATGGTYFRAYDAAALERVYRDLGTRFLVERKDVELSAAFAAAALLAALVAAALSALWLRPAM